MREHPDEILPGPCLDGREFAGKTLQRDEAQRRTLRAAEHRDRGQHPPSIGQRHDLMGADRQLHQPCRRGGANGRNVDDPLRLFPGEHARGAVGEDKFAIFAHSEQCGTERVEQGVKGLGPGRLHLPILRQPVGRAAQRIGQRRKVTPLRRRLVERRNGKARHEIGIEPVGGARGAGEAERRQPCQGKQHEGCRIIIRARQGQECGEDQRGDERGLQRNDESETGSGARARGHVWPCGARAPSA